VDSAVAFGQGETICSRTLEKEELQQEVNYVNKTTSPFQFSPFQALEIKDD
jgi:hypothetical protein